MELTLSDIMNLLFFYWTRVGEVVQSTAHATINVTWNGVGWNVVRM
jgi:hypothetical protein